MGFCMLENPDKSCGWFALNPAYISNVEKVKARDLKAAHHHGPVSHLTFTKEFKDIGVSRFVKGSPQDLDDVFKRTAKLGMGKVLVQLLSGKNPRRPIPLQMGHTNRIVLIKEMMPEEFAGFGMDIVTCSMILFEDNTTRCVVQRPGIIARKVNVGGRVPIFPEVTRDSG